jgi:CRP-like cAMP-binding protein
MVMLIGKFFAAFLIGIVANAIGELSTFRTSFFAFLFRLNQMIKRHASSISVAQNSSINKFLEHSWSVYQGIDQNAVISSLPMDLRVTVVMEISGKVLSESSLFQSCSQSVLRAVAQHIQLEYLPADEQLFSDGQFGDKCYFIGDGEVELTYPTKSSQPIILSRGALLAPQALRACRHSYSIRSITAVQLFSLSSQAFMQLESAFPELTRRYVSAVESDMNSRRPTDLPLVVRQVVSTDHSSQQELIDKMMQGKHQSAAFEIRNAAQPNTDSGTTEPASHWCCADSRSVYQVSDMSLHQSASTYQTAFTISPTSTLYHVLMIAKFMFSFYVVVHQSYRITFQWFHSTTPSDPYDPYFPLDCIADVFFMVDIWLGFRTGFMHRGNLNMHLGDIRQHYIQRGTFLVDFLAVLPLELLCFFPGINVSLGVLRLNKLLRVVFLPSFLHYLASRPGINLALIRFALLLLYMFLLLHFVACGWFGLADIEGFGTDSWIATGTSSDYYAYLNALFLALNLVGGVGDCGIPHTLFELCFANVCSVIGVFMFAFMIGQLESLSSLLDSDRRLFVSRVEQTTQMLGRQQITATTKREVQAYLAYDWSAHRVCSVIIVSCHLTFLITVQLVCAGHSSQRRPAIRARFSSTVAIDFTGSRHRQRSHSVCRRRT